MIRLSDTTIRIYRRKDGRDSLRSRGYMLVETDAAFSLNAYLKSLSSTLVLPCGEIVDMTTGYCADRECPMALSAMLHYFEVSGVVDPQRYNTGLGLLRVDYHINFTGHPSEEPECLEIVVPLKRVRTVFG